MTEYIADLNTSPQTKHLLAMMREPKPLAMIAAKADMAYSTVYQHVVVMVAKGWVKKFKTMGGKTMYQVTDAISFAEPQKGA